ncbi:dual CXXC motif small (seleno)protein [Pseudodesulfovibrio senegalensis]|jgi:predicted amidophosphoribosyltransferase|uniref:dual CXXC motif small (seleno)protein n=1 Tax=Pseudodesulfovibrio senegalensis TaxID=1721087 RepID=UPI003BACCB01
MTFWGKGREPRLVSGMRCSKCDGPLVRIRRCTEVFLRCERCGARLEVRDYARYIDDSFEEDVAHVPMDRI